MATNESESELTQKDIVQTIEGCVLMIENFRNYISWLKEEVKKLTDTNNELTQLVNNQKTIIQQLTDNEEKTKVLLKNNDSNEKRIKGLKLALKESENIVSKMKKEISDLKELNKNNFFYSHLFDEKEKDRISLNSNAHICLDKSSLDKNDDRTIQNGYFNSTRATFKHFDLKKVSTKFVHSDLDVLMKLKHKNIMSVQYYGFKEQRIFLASDYMEVTLNTWRASFTQIVSVNQRHSFTASTKIIMSQTLNVIKYLHDKNYVLRKLSFKGILVDKVDNPSNIKLFDLDKCIESAKIAHKQNDLQIFGHFCYILLTGLDKFPKTIYALDFESFLEYGSAIDAIEQLLKKDNNGRQLTYFINHPFLMDEKRILDFIVTAREELYVTDYHGQKDSYSSFIDLEVSRSWFSRLSSDTRRGLDRYLTDALTNPNFRMYNGRKPEQVIHFMRNLHIHRYIPVIGNNYPTSRVDRLVRPFPWFLPVLYNTLLDNADLVQCEILVNDFNISHKKLDN